eukprot:4179810-Prymnesium_polylepis.1
MTLIEYLILQRAIWPIRPPHSEHPHSSRVLHSPAVPVSMAVLLRDGVAFPVTLPSRLGPSSLAALMSCAPRSRHPEGKAVEPCARLL